MTNWDTLPWHGKMFASEVLDSLAKVYERAMIENGTEAGQLAAMETYMTLDRAASILRGELGAEAETEAREQDRLAAQ